MTMLSPRRELGEFKKRYKWMALTVVVAFLALIVRMAQLQLVEHDHWDAIAEDNVTRTRVIPSTRGQIFDANGNVVATNRPSFDVYMVPLHVQRSGVVRRFFELLELPLADRQLVGARLVQGVQWGGIEWQVVVLRDVTRDQLAVIETHASELRGVDVVAAPAREYPYRRLGGHTIGYTAEVNREDVERMGDDYRAGDVIGRMGIERAFETELRGERGFRRVIVDAHGQAMPVDRAREADMYHAAVPGEDITLTLDMDLMRIIERAFGGHPAGAVAVVDVNSGRVRALFSKPSYDINEMAGRISVDRYRMLTEDPFRPLIDKAVYETYFPGSTFKPVTVFAALEEHIWDPSATVNCPGYYDFGDRRSRCTAAHGEVDMQQSLVRSCNVYVWQLAEQVGFERINRYARLFGFGEPTGLGINSEASGNLATREWYERHYGRFHTGHTLNVAIGQGNTRATLIQMANAYAAIANGGTLYTPQLVERIGPPGGEPSRIFEPHVRSRIEIADEHFEFVRRSLEGVVNEMDGTAYEARIPGGILIAGKTGTAEVARPRPRDEAEAQRMADFNRSHAWFAGYAPADNPQVAIAVLVEHGGGGGRAAAPIAIQVLQEYIAGSIPEPPVETARRP